MKQLPLFFIALFLLTISTCYANDPQAEDYYKEGQNFYREHNFKDAIASLSMAIAIQPEDPSYFFLRGNAYTLDGAYQLALQDFDKAIALKLTDAEYVYARGVFKHRYMGNVDEGIQDYKKAVELDPKMAAYYTSLANVYYFEKSNQNLALENCDKAIELDQKSHEAYYIKSQILTESNQFQEALKYISLAIEYSPEEFRYYNGRGVIYAESGEPEKGLEDFTKAINLCDPEFNEQLSLYYRNRAVARTLISPDLQFPLEDYNKAIEWSPFQYSYWAERGDLYSKSGNGEEANQDYQVAQWLQKHDGNKILFIENKPFVDHGILFIPISDIADWLGAALSRNTNGSISIKLDQETLTITTGSSSAEVNGMKVTLKQQPVELRGSIFVSLDVMTYIFGLTGDIDPTGKILALKYKDKEAAMRTVTPSRHQP